MIPNSIVKCWKKFLFFGLKVAKKILIKGSAKMKSTSTTPTNELPKTLGQWVVASFEVEQSITTGNQAPRLRHATHHLCTRPTSPPQLSLSLSLSLFLSTETPLWPTPCAHTHISFHFHFRFQLRPIASLPNYPRQRCRLNICSYIGWIDKYCICQFNQYNNKYWDGGAV